MELVAPKKSNKEAMQELMDRLQDHKAYFNYCLKIQELGTKKLIPFKMNSVQKILHEVAQQQLKDIGHVRIIVLKARRFGISTYVQARMFKRAATMFNQLVHICTHSKNTTSEMFQMTKVMEQNYPDFIKPLSHYSGKQELTWGSVDGKGLNSRYGMSTVEGSEVVGAGIDMLHCSEVARWGSRAKEYATGLMNCVMQGYGTEIWLESTAKGVGNYFEREWWRAEKDDSGLKPIFFPWFVFDEYETELTKEEKKDDSFIKTMGNNPTFGAEEEKGLLGVEISYKTKEGDIVFKITPENLKWRRNKIISPECQGDLNVFHQEYPTTAREAFVASGRSAFDSVTLTQMWFDADERDRESPPTKFEVPVNGFNYKNGAEEMRYFMKRHKEGELSVFNPPQIGREYRIGVDVSEGILSQTGDSDYSVITVLDAETYEECATWSARIDPDLLAWVIKTIATWYNLALVAVENNNHGLLTLKFLSSIHSYENLYIEKALDERGQRQKKRLGFNTNIKTRKLILDLLRRLIRERQIDIFSKTTVDELQTFVINKDGKEIAQHGCHDDRVMSLAIAAYMCYMYPHDPSPTFSFPKSQRTEYYVKS
jgi:hypothetical protein